MDGQGVATMCQLVLLLLAGLAIVEFVMQTNYVRVIYSGQDKRSINLLPTLS